MADNVTLPGTGAAIRAKNIGGVDTQLVGVDIGGEFAEIQLSANNPMPTTIIQTGFSPVDPTAIGTTNNNQLQQAQSSDTPLFTVITGDPNGDFAGVNVLESWITNKDGLAAPTTNADLKKDQYGAQFIADCYGPIYGSTNSSAPSGQTLFIVDTTGYQSISIETLGLSGTQVMGWSSNTGAATDWIAVTGMYSSNGTSTQTALTIGSNGNNGSYNGSNVLFQFPTIGRWFKATVPAGGQANVVAYLRSQPCAGSVVNTGLSFATGFGSGSFAYVPVQGNTQTTPPAGLASGLGAPLTFTSSRQLIVKSYGSVEGDWQATSGTAGLATVTATALVAAGSAGIRNYCTGIDITNNAATANTVTLLDGATVIWVGYLPASLGATISRQFTTPRHGTAATAMNIQLSAATSVFYNAEGYQSA
jgi:hypothetical protein